MNHRNGFFIAVIAISVLLTTALFAQTSTAGNTSKDRNVSRTIETDFLPNQKTDINLPVKGNTGANASSITTTRTGDKIESNRMSPVATFRKSEPSYYVPEGPRVAPTVVDGIDLIGIGIYCWGVTYDWDRDALWVTQFNSSVMYLIAKTSPLTILGSVTISGIVPTYYLGIAYAGSDILYMCGYDGSIYQIDVITGAGSLYRTSPWTGEQGLGWSVADDAAYPGDWTLDQCAYAIPSLTGAWNLWAQTDVSGLAASYDAITNPSWLWVVDELSPQAYLYQYGLTNGVPDAVPTITWDLPAEMTMLSTADCAYDGQYVYVLDQSLNTDSIYVLDPTLASKDAQVVSIDYPNIGCFVMTPAVPVTVQATIQNNGASSETFNVDCSIDSAGTIIYNDTESVTLASGASTQVSFAPQWNAPVEDVNYYVSVKTLLAGDEDPSNDSLQTRAKAVTWTDELIYDDGTMANAWYYIDPHYDSLIAKMCEPPYYPCHIKYAAVYLLSEGDPYWPFPDATHDSVALSLWLDTDGDNIPDNMAFKDTVCGDGIAPSWVYVVPEDTIMITGNNFWVSFNNISGGGSEGMGLDAATNFPLNNYVYTGTWHTQDKYAGDEMIRAYVTMGDLEHDVGIISIDVPSGINVDPDVAINPEATVHNFGQNIESFTVTCTIDSCGSVKYNDSQPVNNLNVGGSTPVSFASWTPSANNGVVYTLTFVANLTGDQIPSNDTLITTVVTGQTPTRNYLLIQNYWSWYSITGYASIDSICQDHGIPLTIYGDTCIGVIDLSPYTKVIIPSDQDTVFYETVQANIGWFKSYVQNGGILQVDAADYGSGSGGVWDTLSPLPCDYMYHRVWNDNAQIEMDCHEIVLIPNKIGSPELGTWNYVTHGYVTNIGPPEVDTVMTNQEFQRGTACLTVDRWYAGDGGRSGGVVIYTTMTLEWAWAYNYSRVLENVVLYPNWVPSNVGVELTGFSASVSEGGILLRWETASELGNVAWSIERKGENGEWLKVTTVPSSGNSPGGSEYSYTDNDVDLESIHYYRLGSIDVDGDLEWHNTIRVDPHSLGIPLVFGLHQNYPNPFNNGTTIRYQVPRKTDVEIDIYDVSGRHIRKLVRGVHEPGYYSVIWRGNNRNDRDTGIGIYFCRMNASDYTNTKRLIKF